MWRVLGVSLAVLPLAACLWHPPGADARPRVGLAAVERVPPAGTPGSGDLAVAEPGARGWLFSDSLILLRTQAYAGSIRVRLWNRGREPLRVLPAAGSPARVEAAGPCPDSADAWELRTEAAAEVLDAGGSWERTAVPVAGVRSPLGPDWRTTELRCFVFDPAAPRAALRLAVERGGVRYLYTLWYRLIEPPTEDEAATNGARRGEAPAPR